MFQGQQRGADRGFQFLFIAGQEDPDNHPEAQAVSSGDEVLQRVTRLLRLKRRWSDKDGCESQPRDVRQERLHGFKVYRGQGSREVADDGGAPPGRGGSIPSVHQIRCHCLVSC